MAKRKLAQSPEKKLKYHLNEQSACEQSAVENAWHAGQVFNDQRKALRHGEFESWCKANCDKSKSSIAVYMRLNNELTIETILSCPSLNAAKKMIPSKPKVHRDGHLKERNRTEPTKNSEEPAGIQAETVDTFGPIAGDIPPDAEIAAPVIQHRDEPPKEVWEDTAEGSLEPETEEMTDAELVWGFGVFEIAQWIKHDATESDAETLRTCLDAKFPKEPKPKKRNGFQPPTLDEVEIYADSYGLERPDWPKQPDVADRFFDHFESNGWKVGGKAPMKDWKAALRNFGRNDFGNGSAKPKADFDSIIDAMEFGETK